MNIYADIRAFLEKPSLTANDIVDFAEDLIKRYPESKQFIQSWLLDMVVKPQFSRCIFNDTTNKWFKGLCLYPQAP